jgi:competence protein ComEC
VTPLLASLVVGFATTPYAAFHFHRIAPYGVLANLAAMPVVSALVMPAGMLGLLAMPFGFDGFFWWLMGLGIGWMILAAGWVAHLPAAIGHMAAFGMGPLIAGSLGLILMGLLRWSGAVVLVFSVVWAVVVTQPDIMVSGDGRNIAVRGRDGRLHLMRTAKDAFLVKEWLAADADPRSADDPSLADGVSCDDAGCVVPAADGAMVAQTLRPDALTDDCIRAVPIVAVRAAPGDCAAAVIDQSRLRRQGGLTLRRRGSDFVIEAVKPKGLDRPWSPASPDEGENEMTLTAKPAVRRSQDATPSETDLQADD